jgi:endonuclease/exonuclease/phosphatase family metal-dependent hydrolase
MERLGEDAKDYPVLARVISRFDVVAAEEVMNVRGMQSVLRQLGPAWSKAMSEASEGSKKYREFYGFFYDEKIELVKMLGPYPGKRQFLRPPYGAEFKAKGSDLTFTLVACHIIYGKSERARVQEIRHLGEVYRYFEGLTGSQGTTIIPAKGTTMGASGPGHAYDHMFLPPALRVREVSADVDYWTTDFAGSRKNVSDHFPIYLVLRTGT